MKNHKKQSSMLHVLDITIKITHPVCAFCAIHFGSTILSQSTVLGFLIIFIGTVGMLSSLSSIILSKKDLLDNNDIDKDDTQSEEEKDERKDE